MRLLSTPSIVPLRPPLFHLELAPPCDGAVLCAIVLCVVVPLVLGAQAGGQLPTCYKKHAKTSVLSNQLIKAGTAPAAIGRVFLQSQGGGGIRESVALLKPVACCTQLERHLTQCGARRS